MAEPLKEEGAECREFIASESRAEERLDRVLTDLNSDLSRSRLQALIRDECVSLNGEVVIRPRQPVSPGDRIEVRIPPARPAGILPQDIPLEVTFEDEYLIVIDKPAGLVVHPAAGNPDGTLVNALLFHCRGQLSGIGGVERPGIVHRLDRETSGCLVAAKTDAAHRGLTAQFSNREVSKTYLCVVQGRPDSSEGRIENRIGRHPVNRQRMAVVPEPKGKSAITDYRVLESAQDDSWSLVRCEIHTGRTHQIRVHMKESLRCPILGDSIYAQVSRQSLKPGRSMLHAWKLGFLHPVTAQCLAFESPLPPEFEPFKKADRH